MNFPQVFQCNLCGNIYPTEPSDGCHSSFCEPENAAPSFSRLIAVSREHYRKLTTDLGNERDLNNKLEAKLAEIVACSTNQDPLRDVLRLQMDVDLHYFRVFCSPEGALQHLLNNLDAKIRREIKIHL